LAKQVTWISPEHLSGKTIGAGCNDPPKLYRQYYVPKGQRQGLSETGQANVDLAAGRVDYLMADGVALRDYLMSDEGKACCELKALFQLHRHSRCCWRRFAQGRHGALDKINATGARHKGHF
jgi:ABC-type amino acid transport substrate-binding protein